MAPNTPPDLRPLDWAEVQQATQYARQRATQELLSLWPAMAAREGDPLLWGDEVEAMIVQFDHARRLAPLSLAQGHVLSAWEARQSSHAASKDPLFCSLQPEYAGYMIESTPARPYAATPQGMCQVEPNMRQRRTYIQEQLGHQDKLVTLATYPLLGGTFPPDAAQDDDPSGGPAQQQKEQNKALTNGLQTWVTGLPDPEHTDVPGPILNSAFIPDEVISPFHRYRVLSLHTRKRRQDPTAIYVPLYRDMRTVASLPPPLHSAGALLTHRDTKGGVCEAADSARSVVANGSVRAGASHGEGESANGSMFHHGHHRYPESEDHIFMDALPFGTGCCGLQATIQASSLTEARQMHDHLVSLAPFLLALTAASPGFRGALANVDARWSVLAQACDDRTPTERGEAGPAFGQVGPNGLTTGMRLHQSRWGTCTTYLGSEQQGNKAEWNDVPHSSHNGVYKELVRGGMDPILARHFSQILLRDPLLLFPPNALPGTKEAQETHERQAQGSTDFLDRFLTTTWPVVKLKTPPRALNHDQKAGAPSDSIGWRVEARSMEVQLTDLENAAFTTFTVLLVRTLLYYKADVYMPLSLVDTNMHRAEQRDAIRSQRFWFRCHLRDQQGIGQEDTSMNLLSMDEIMNGKVRTLHIYQGYFLLHEVLSIDTIRAPTDSSRPFAFLFAFAILTCLLRCVWSHLTVPCIFVGVKKKKQGNDFQGLIPLVRRFLDEIGETESMRPSDQEQLDRYLNLIADRASGRLWTLAHYMRHFATSHPAYKKDSRITPMMAYDLLWHLHQVEEGAIQAPHLLPSWYGAEGQEAEPEEREHELDSSLKQDHVPNFLPAPARLASSTQGHTVELGPSEAKL